MTDNPQSKPAAKAEPARPQMTPPANVRMGKDGVYRWSYSFDMLKNPVLLFTIWKVLAIAVGATWLLVLLMEVFGGAFDDFGGFLKFSMVFVFVLLGFLVVGLIAYLILASIYGWRYQVIFEMDDKGVTHRQMPAQFGKAQALSLIELLTAQGLTGAGAAILAGSKNESSVAFNKLKSIRTLRRYQTIKVNERMEHCQVYAKQEDFDFVLNYILEHAPKGIKVK